jgi:hypothetical protein
LCLPTCIILGQGLSNDYNVDDNELNVEDLTQEFKDIMLIPKSERTIEEWDRALEIVFILYSKFNIKSLLNDLQSELDNYKELTTELEEIQSDLESVYEQELKVLSNLTELQDNLKFLLDNNFKFSNYLLYFDVKAGYTFNLGLSVGFGVSFFLNDKFSIGAYVNTNTDFKDTTFFSIMLSLGVGI